MRQEKWLDKPYYSLDAYMKYTYGQKVYKIAVDAGLTCPNRDGTLSDRGCIFCSAGGSGDFAVPVYEHRSQRTDTMYERCLQVSRNLSPVDVYHKEYNRRGSYTNPDRKVLDVKRQIERGMAKFHKKVGEKFVIYFQAYTNTYGDLDYLESIWRAALNEESVIGISIATRPDCLGEPVMQLLLRLKKEYAAFGKFVWIELGLQTIHEKTAEYIRRGYPLSVYEHAISLLAKCDIPYITHVILGLPGETKEDMLETVRYVCQREQQRPFGIKLQLLHVLQGTDLCKDFEAGAFSVLDMDTYLELVITCLEHIPEEIVIHRVTGDGPKNLLVAPLWSGNKRLVLNTLHKKMKDENRMQGASVFPPAG